MAGVERLDLLKKTWAAREEKRRRGELGGSKVTSHTELIIRESTRLMLRRLERRSDCS